MLGDRSKRPTVREQIENAADAKSRHALHLTALEVLQRPGNSAKPKTLRMWAKACGCGNVKGGA